MFDREILRNQQLIEERIEYENDFIYIEGIEKSDELDCYAHPQYEQYLDEKYIFEDEYYVDKKLDTEFDLEDACDLNRDEQLIEMYEAQIEAYYKEINHEIIEYDSLDAAIEDYNQPPEPDYYDCFDAYDECWVEEIPMDASYCGGQLIGYVVNDSGFCDYDYPEGPDENLQGLRFGEPCYFEEYESPHPDFDSYECRGAEYEILDDCGEYLFDNEEQSIQKMISDRIREENDFFEFVKEYELKDEYLLPIDCDDILLC